MLVDFPYEVQVERSLYLYPGAPVRRTSPGPSGKRVISWKPYEDPESWRDNEVCIDAQSLARSLRLGREGWGG